MASQTAGAALSGAVAIAAVLASGGPSPSVAPAVSTAVAGAKSADRPAPTLRRARLVRVADEDRANKTERDLERAGPPRSTLGSLAVVALLLAALAAVRGRFRLLAAGTP